MAISEVAPSAHRALAPNRGVSVKDSDTIEEGYPKHEWLASRGIDKAKRVVLTRLSHMRYQSPDLERMTEFLLDFGMVVVKETPNRRWFGGYGPDNYVYYVEKGPSKFLGGTFEVQSYGELEKVLQIPALEVIGGIQEMTDAPGGGHILTIKDREGFLVNFVHGQAKKEAEVDVPPQLDFNYETVKSRARKFLRFEEGPAPVYKLGHFGLCVNDFPSQLDFYTKNFNIVPSDVLYVAPGTTTDGKPDRKEVAIFAHLDLGQDLVDHHTLFLSTVPPSTEPHVHHCSFEIHDFDTQALGHQWLARKGYESVWGVGRHILGSQVFDYWWNPDHFMIEHYADGDLVNEDTPLAFGPATNEGLAVWGPDVPQTFLD